MKKALKTLAGIGAMTLLLVTLFSVTSLLMVSAAVDAGNWIIGGEGNVTANDDGTLNVVQGSSAVLNYYVNTKDENLDVSVKFTAPFDNANQHVLVYLTKDPTVSVGSGAITPRFSLDGEKYGLSHAWLNGTDFVGYGGGYIPISNGSVTIRIKNDNGVVRLYMDDTCIYHADHATQFSDAVKALGGAYLGVAVQSAEGPITAKILEVNGATPVTVEAPTTTTTEETTTTTEEVTTTTSEEETTTTSEEETTTTTEGETTTTTIAPATKEPAAKADWKGSGATFNADGSISVGANAFLTLDKVIDMNDPNLDLKWVVNVEDIPHVANADLANFCFYFYSPLSETTPVAAADAEFYRTRFFIDDGDVFRYSEVIRGEAADWAWGMTDIADYFMWDGSYDVEFHLYNDNGLIRFTANGKQFVPADDYMKNHSDYLKACGEVYFGLSVNGNDTVLTLETFDGAEAYKVVAGGEDDTTTTTVVDSTTTTTADGGESPDTGVAGMAGVLAVIALAAVTGGVLTVKKRA